VTQPEAAVVAAAVAGMAALVGAFVAAAVAQPKLAETMRRANPR
jgi:hypothetical protein